MTAHVISDPTSFHREAQSQRVCAICDRPGGRPNFRGERWEAHHVIPKQLLRRLKLPQYDIRGALRLCTDCHGGFENGGVAKVLIPIAKLKGMNICYVWETLGVTCGQIERPYEGTFEEDPRWLLHELEECPLCR